MEELLKRITGMGVSIESWLLSFVVASLMALFRIFESDVAPTARKQKAIIIMGLTSCLLVPGLVVYWMKIDNAFVAALITGLTVYTFEQALHLAKDRFLGKFKKGEKNDTNDHK